MVDICILLLCTNPRIFPSNKTRCVYICGSLRDFRVVLGLQESQQYCWASKWTEKTPAGLKVVKSFLPPVERCENSQNSVTDLPFILFPTKTIKHYTEKLPPKLCVSRAKCCNYLLIFEYLKCLPIRLKFPAPKLARIESLQGGAEVLQQTI